MLKWCPCMGWCLTDSTAGGEAKILLNSMTTPNYNVRRISSFGQTILNEAGEEEEIARHGSVPVETLNGKTTAPWSASPIPVQPGVTKADVMTRMHKMASIPEVSSPNPRNRFKKNVSEAGRQMGEMSPLRPRKKIPTPEEFAEVSYQHDNASDVSSIISETHSEGRIKEGQKSADTVDKEVSPRLEAFSGNEEVESISEKSNEKPSASLFHLVKAVKKSKDEPPRSPGMKTRISSEKPKSPLSKPKIPESSSPIPKKNMEPPKIVVEDNSVSENVESEVKTEEETKFERKEVVGETYKQIKEEVDVEAKFEEDDEDEDDEEELSQTASQSTTQLGDEEMDEVTLKRMDSAEIAKQYGLDLNLYDIDSTMGLSAGSKDDDLSANISIAKIQFSASLNKEKNQLMITLEKLDGLGGQGSKNSEFDVVIKLGFLKGGHTYSSKASQPSKPINQNFSLHVKDLATSILRFSVYNSAWQGGHDALGHALFRVSKCTHSVTHHTLSISPKSNITESAGLIEVSFRIQSKFLYVIVHKVFDLLPLYRGCKLYSKVSYYSASRKKEKISKTETGDKGYVLFDFESKFNADKITEQHTYIMISLKKKGENNKLFKNDKTLGRIFLGPLFYTGNKINFWGEAILKEKIMTHTFSLYL